MGDDPADTDWSSGKPPALREGAVAVHPHLPRDGTDRMNTDRQRVDGILPHSSVSNTATNAATASTLAAAPETSAASAVAVAFPSPANFASVEPPKKHSSCSSFGQSTGQTITPGESNTTSMTDSGLESEGLGGKRKAELIESLVNENDGNADFEEEAPPKQMAKTQGTAVPSTTLTTTSLNGVEREIDDSHCNRKNDGKEINPEEEKLYRDVLKQYPPLHDFIDPDTLEHVDPTGGTKPEGLGEHDIRQTHHPMLKGMRCSDLDVVFVGTASCIPGMTRGVSCTALRLQWRRKSKNLGTKVKDRNKKGAHSDTDTSKIGGPDGRYNKSGSFNGGGQSSARGTWLFDCGESTQLQIQRTGSIKPGKISKIFITHAHGDHSFGLPGLLCLMGTNRDRDSPPIDIYGPEGLRAWLRVAIRYSVSRIVPPYRVHEIMDIPMAPEWEEAPRNPGRFFLQLEKAGGKGGAWVGKGLAGDDPTSWISRAPMINLKPSSQFGEIAGGRDIFPIYDHPLSADGAPIWEVEDEGDVRVFAAPMSHGVPCVGYVVEEESKPGRLRPDLVEPIVKRNYAALRDAGMKAPMKVMAVIKDLPEGGSFTFPDGTLVKQSDVVEPSRQGRKVAICGDTSDARAMEGIAKGADLVIHEATNAFLTGIDKDTTKGVVTKDAIIHGHSTPEMAGKFARKVGAKRLVLNHFSPRYKGDQSIDSLSIMTRIERQALRASSLPTESVAAAWDLMILPIPQTESES
mmetsp:Transcript_14686/g.29696  ORF Transcript_14686/g.29696 Transcript_14686/m.29696 type:complete len:744 (-) Transcript_14686:349-2580(-)